MIKLIHKLCLEAKLETGEISEAMAKTPVDEEPVEDAAIVTGGPAEVIENYKDEDLVSEPSNGRWLGDVYWMKLGLPVGKSVPHDGKF